MANYKLGPVIGKIGGAEVEVTPVSISASGNGETVVGYTARVPAGEEWLIAASGTIASGGTSASYHPTLSIGQMTFTFESGAAGMANPIVGPAEVVFSFTKNRNQGTDTFVGHIYTVPLPA